MRTTSLFLPCKDGHPHHCRNSHAANPSNRQLSPCTHLPLNISRWLRSKAQPSRSRRSGWLELASITPTMAQLAIGFDRCDFHRRIGLPGSLHRPFLRLGHLLSACMAQGAIADRLGQPIFEAPVRHDTFSRRRLRHSSSPSRLGALAGKRTSQWCERDDPAPCLSLFKREPSASRSDTSPTSWATTTHTARTPSGVCASSPLLLIWSAGKPKMEPLVGMWGVLPGDTVVIEASERWAEPAPARTGGRRGWSRSAR